MPPTYLIQIDPGHTPVNDSITCFLSQEVRDIAHGQGWLDIGCNTGSLIRRVGYGTGIDDSPHLIQIARQRGIDAIVGNAEAMPFKEKSFALASLSCIIEQSSQPIQIIKEALRVAHTIIGISPYPNTKWGKIGGWVQSVTPPATILTLWPHSHIHPFDRERFFFKIENNPFPEGETVWQ